MDNPQVIFEDDYILALNKPAGFVVNDSNTISDAPSLQDWIDKNYDFEIAHNKMLRNGIVHRLDKPTSGIILVAKNENIFHELQKEFFDREVNKVYVALVHGEMQGIGEINAKIGRLPWKRSKFGVIDNGRDALTKYKVARSVTLSEVEGSKEYSLLELYPKTGRTHQLRVHLKHIGHPIVGDFLYAGRKVSKKDLQIFGRLMLHAKEIEFIHPVTKKKIKLETNLPKEFEKFL
ncbi:MAG TPA: RluA family pseudouridine synthase [Patescibacteria group bacterium]|nr:RluA family pseudouridine synthase [Patescibacteria group bacterium]